MIGLIWAQTLGGVIGANGLMPWHLPEDLAHFRSVTHGGAVIMGRRTWDSLPERYRPLPGRQNVVVTRQRDWAAEGASVAHSLEDALSQTEGPVWVIGGAEIYRLALPYADILEVTEIDAVITGDTFAPTITTGWNNVETGSTTGWLRSSAGLPFRFVRYQRAPTS
ncbi:MAG: dihydrofolate reductase [Cryobacterium sp.]|uniref:dihydrofolate reductase n=1 Tax=unclassified Cryobacterium TaxID=2649013 RepID=UPI0018C8EFAB|nr:MULTISPECIES: dihydrofolate reductase [unclassified Cryobacterium]MCY7405669.1 dihydrofolate reductase [Cryobacterium sp.]MEC5155097.1 dihydrofolate reductase [Cryobacterium sp. CAN_C3]